VDIIGAGNWSQSGSLETAFRTSGPAGGSISALVRNTDTADEQTVEARVKASPWTNDEQGFSVLANFIDSDNFYYGNIQRFQGLARIVKVVAGVFTVMTQTSSPYSSGTFVRIKLTTENNGSNKDLEFFRDGVSLLTVSTSDKHGTGQAGLLYHGVASGNINDYDWWAFNMSQNISSVVPSSGGVSGGTNVAINGTDIGDSTLAEFGGLPATGNVATPNTKLDCITPAGALGFVDVKIKFGTLGSEEFTFTLASAYEYTADPLLDLGRVNQQFLDAQKAPASEMKKELKAWLRNVAASAEGSVATGDDLDADHPASGAIDGDAAHLNFGPGSGAENGIGKGGWKSSAASLLHFITSASDWNGGVQTNIKTINDAIETAFDTSRYEQDFDGLADGALATQDGWANISGTGTIDVGAAFAFGGGGKGLQLKTAGGQTQRVVRRSITFGTKVTLSHRLQLKDITGGPNFILGATGTGQVIWGFDGTDNTVKFFSGSWKITTVRHVTPINIFERWVIHLDRTTAASTVFRLFIDGVQIHEMVLDTTGMNEMDIRSGGVTSETYFDDLRIGDNLQDTGQQENVFDLGADPVNNGRAELSFNGEAKRVETLLPGAFYGAANDDGPTTLRAATTQDRIAQTFEVDSDGVMTGVLIYILRAGTPAPAYKAVVSLEIANTTGGTPEPGTVVHGRSVEIDTASIGTSSRSVLFDFPTPIHLKAGVRYALILDGKFDIDAVNHIDWRSDNSAPGYTNGQAFMFDSGTASWSSLARDQLFAVIGWLQEETGFAGNDPIAQTLRTSSTFANFAQGFKVPFDTKIQYLQLPVRQVGTLPVNSTIWWELWSDNGASPGKPLALIQEGYHHDATVISGNPIPHDQFVLSLPREVEVFAGVQYHWVLRGNWAFASSPGINIQADVTGSTYPDGTRNFGDDSFPIVWSPPANEPPIVSDFDFKILGTHRPSFRFDAAYSTDDITYGTFQKITDNPKRLGSLADIAFTGEKKRFWKIRAEAQRKTTDGLDEPWTPILSDYTVKAIFRTRKELRVDMGQSRVIRGMEIYAHPTEHGMRQIVIEHSTDDISFTPITAFDELASRRKGGGASDPVNVAGTITTDGDYIRVIFDADITMRYFKIFVEDNDDEFARIMEVRAFRVEDWTDRWVKHSEGQSGDPLFRKVEARSMTISLRNDDGFLSAKRTEGGFNDQVGPGVRLFPKIGYTDGATLVRRGVFYVEKWPEKIKDPTIQVKSRDGTKIMNTQVRAKFTARRRTTELIEYLGNLSGIPSTDMNLDQSGDSINFYLGKEVNAYQEAQKIAESVAFSRLFFDEEGYLVFQIVGNGVRDTEIQADGSLATPRRTMGPPAFVGDKMYILISEDAGGGDEDINLFEWDIATSVWTNRGIVATGEARMNGALIAFDERIWIATWEAPLPNLVGKLQVYDPSDLSVTEKMNLLPEFSIADYDSPGHNDGPGANDGIVRSMVSQLVQGHRWIISCESSRLRYKNKPYEIDLFKLRDKAHTDITGWDNSERIIHALRTESDKLVGLTKREVGGDIKAIEWDYDAKTVTNKVTFPSMGGNRGHVVGMDNVGDGTLWLAYSTNLGVGDVGARLSTLDVSGDTWIFTEGDAVADVATLAPFAEGDGVVYADGLILGYWGKPIGSDSQYRFMGRDLKAPNVENTDIGPIGSGGTSRVGQFRSHTDVNGVVWIYGIMDDFRIFELRVRGVLPAQEVSTKIISEDSEGLLRDMSADRTDEAGGEAAIINVAYIKSRPLIAEPDLEQVWEGSDFPWAVNKDTLIEFDVELEEECDPSTIAFQSPTPQFADGGAGVATLKDVIDGGSTIRSTSRVRISIDVTAGGRLTGLALEGKPLRRQGTLIAVALGKPSSKNRFGIREFFRQNDYIYNPMNLMGLAKSLVDRFQTPKQRITGLRALALWDLQLFDRTTLIAATLGINGDYYITGIQGSFEDPDMTFDAIEV